jgi:CBS domain-containing protein
MTTTVSEVMTRRVVALREGAGYKEIVTALRHYQVSACPVIDEKNRVLGVVSAADLLHKQADPELPSGLRRISRKLSEQTKATALTARQLMTAPAIVIDPSAPLMVAAKFMQDNQIKRLPVATPDGHLVGIISRTDLLSVFERPDADIWDDVIKIMVSEDLALSAENFDITVQSGIVTLCGLIDRRETALNLLARVRHAEGIVGVRDRLSYPAGASEQTARRLPMSPEGDEDHE